jgi:myo-inositol-1(or 4)-monophosphatase
MTDMDLDALLAAADRAARAGGEIVRSHFGTPDGIREKSPGDWVSAADLASENAVRAVLERDTGLPVFGEEEGGDRAEVGWLVDPLDGTSNFLHGLEAVGVSVGLVAAGEPVVGVVHAPLLDRTYAARLGGGAFRDERRLHVSSRAPDQAIVATGFPFRHKDLLARYEPAFSAAIHTFEDLRRVGGASLDLCWTAEGVFDGYFELALGPWDVAAGALIVREAGGIVTDWEGDPTAWLTSGNILAGPPQVHATLGAIASAGGEIRR